MTIPTTSLLPGCYQYSYPTFSDTPQFINVHFLTPDGLHAFVSYPRHPNRKAAGLISLTWFASVSLQRLAGQPSLLDVIDTLCTGWSLGQGWAKPLPALQPWPLVIYTDSVAA